MLKRNFLGALVAGVLTSAPLLAQAQVIVRIAPPPPRIERVPPPRRGHVWAPGRWDYRGRRYVWTNGHWLRVRNGHRWEPDRWVERNGGWHQERGRWMRGDRDGDGVPNRLDSAPDNPRRN